MALTEKRIARITKRGRVFDGHGLYLQTTKSGVKSWILRYARGDRERYFGLGPLHTINLKQARERARAAREQLLDGIDPVEARRKERRNRKAAAERQLTFAAAAAAYFEQHANKWRNQKHRAQFLASLNEYAFPKIGETPLADIDTPAVLRVLEQPVAARAGYPAGQFWIARTETANRVRSRIESVLDWATVRGYRSGDNPARWKGHLAEVFPSRGKIAKTEHHPALPFTELPAFITDLAKRNGTAARALEFLILTAARTGEVIGAVWDEIDLTARVWTVPAGRIKGGREHRVPLADRAVEILRALPREKGNTAVFISPARRDALGDMAMAALLKRMKRLDITVHGFRSTFRDWAAERTAYPNHVVEQALAHSIGSAVEAAYRRSDLLEKRVRLMAEWAAYCMSPAPEGAVIPMRGRR
jgi:integrase